MLCQTLLGYVVLSVLINKVELTNAGPTMLQNVVLIYCDRLARAQHKNIVGMVVETVGG